MPGKILPSALLLLPFAVSGRPDGSVRRILGLRLACIGIII